MILCMTAHSASFPAAVRTRPVLLLFILSLVARVIAANPLENAAAEAGSAAIELSRDQTSEQIRVISSSARGLEFEFVPDSFVLGSTPDGAVVSAPGTDRLAMPGEPDLPGRVVLVGVPQEGRVRLSVAVEQTEKLSGIDIRPAPGFTPAIQHSAFGQNRFWPEAVAELVGIERVRNVRIARIRLNPVQYNPGTNVVRMHRRLKVTVVFDRAGEPVYRTDPLDLVLERMLLNGSLARTWKLDSDQDSFNFFERSDVWCKVKVKSTGMYKITGSDLTKAGLGTDGVDPRTFRLYSIGPYEINRQYPDTMIEVPVYVKGEEDGRFDKGDHIAFYAEAPSTWKQDSLGNLEWVPNLFTRYQYLWLTWGFGPGARMGTVSGAGALAPRATALNRVRLEQDKLCPARSGLLWLWERYFKQAGVESGFHYRDLDLSLRDTIYSISGRLYGRKEPGDPTPRYYVRIHLNGVVLDTIVVIPRHATPTPADFVFDNIPVEAGARPGMADTLGFELYGDPQTEIFLDYLEVRYAERLEVSASAPEVQFWCEDSGIVDFGIEGASGDAIVLDVTDPWNPKRIIDTEVSGSSRKVRAEVSGRARFVCGLPRYLTPPLVLERRSPGRLRNPAEWADYYVVCPDEFYAAGRVFARYREGNIAGITNARVRAVQLSDIYDDYAFGMEEPGAIKKFLSLKQPTYGLLAGDATYDYRDNLQYYSSDSLKYDLDSLKTPSVPTYEVGFDIDPEVYGSIAKSSDLWYADFDGEGANPDMILARVTCRNAMELRQFLEKVKKYETQPLGFWAKRFLLLADDEWLGEPVMSKRDPIGFSHIGGCENMILYAGGLLDPVKIYLTEYPFTGVNDKAAARTELYNQLDRGVLLWCFFGHGAGFQLCHERALHIDGVPQVETGTRNSLAFFGSCGVGRFDDTRYECIAEELVRKQSGCIATTGASKATVPGGNEYFARLLFSGLVENPDEPIGPAFFETWVTTRNDLYHLFGDPATLLRLPAEGDEPVVMPDTFYPGARVSVVDSVPVAQGMYGISVHEADRFRTYSSDAGATSYVLPGYEIHNALGSFDSSLVQCSFVVPDTVSGLLYPDTVVVPNGSYVRLANSSSVSFLCWDEAKGYSSRHNLIPFGEPVQTEDTVPPELTLFADGWRLSTEDTVSVPKQFVLKGTLSDESGILLAPLPDYGLSLRGAGISGRVELHTRFSYDKNSVTRGRFSYPVKMGLDLDSVTVVAADNMHNRLVSTYYVRTELSGMLRLDTCLVYPNPAQGPARFTFVLTRAAFVSVKIYTISGRLVRRLPARPCSFGYNQIEWDGLDEQGAPLANGIYLYKLDARVSEATGGGTQTSFRDKFIVHR